MAQGCGGTRTGADRMARRGRRSIRLLWQGWLGAEGRTPARTSVGEPATR